MQTNLLWQGREYFSLESCLVDSALDGCIINSAIVGYYQEKIYRVEYIIKTNTLWQTLFVEITAWHDNEKQNVVLKGDGNGNWTMNGKTMAEFAGCIDVDIPLTPFTNTLPINRLKQGKDQTQKIKVIYCDILEKKISAVRQKYTCISPTSYHYENVPNDFEATIEVDDLGFVVDYPELFVRKAAMSSNYTG
nr:putative glycolipid-binding domain-containing protein [uncultured Mucilaginibacter sp.]